MYVEHLKRAGFTQVRGMDWTDRFVDIHRRELEHLPEAGLADKDATELEQGWRAKIARARNGEQRWGATHQQNGQHWGNANGNHGAQKPTDVGTAVRSTCQTWLGRFAVTTELCWKVVYG